jgi:hypothetical protein
MSGTYEPHETICTPSKERVRRLKRRPPDEAGVRWGSSRGVGTGKLDETDAADTAAPWEMFSKDMNPYSTGSRLTAVEAVINKYLESEPER